ncbi:Hypothetical predicted protein [Pelobates cultripes]|uniref:VPS9 domain-containing protein n=1 Tax=Pelobates cultripes TaxID=61616 RepID=A0AAD1TCS4_PELCU|nr:Hypothetical predicted protein [Pelobates cultripes]
MASPVGDGGLRPLQKAMKLANRAIELDTGNQHKEAYMEYLKSVSYISHCLLEEAEQKADSELLASDSQKLLKLAGQCLERARTTAEKLGTTNLDNVSPATHISNVPDPPPPPPLPPPKNSSVDPVVSKSSHFPRGRSFGHRRACSDEVQKLGPFPTPEIFQKLQANEARKPKKALTPLEEASLQNQKLRASYEARLSRLNPNQASQKTSLTLSLQRQIMENVVIAKAKEAALQRKAQERRIRLQEESYRLFSKSSKLTKEEEEQRALHSAILEFDHDHEWSRTCRIQLKSNPKDTDLFSSFMYQILSYSDHPITQLVGRYQYQIYERLYPIIIMNEDSHQTENFSKLYPSSFPTEGFHLLDTDVPPLKSSLSLQFIPSSPAPSLTHSFSLGEKFEFHELSVGSHKQSEHGESEIETSFEDLEDFLPPKDMLRLSPQERLRAMVKEICNARDEMLSLVIVSLDLSDVPDIRSLCIVCLDESFFSLLWSPIIALYRQVYGHREESMLKNMDLYASCHPSVVGVSTTFYPDDIKEPYKPVADELDRLIDLHNPQRKIECVVAALRLIVNLAEKYSPKHSSSPIGADDLLALLVYILLRYRMSHLVSECAAIEDFLMYGYILGEDGYGLVSMYTALSYLEHLHIRFPLPENE